MLMERLAGDREHCALVVWLLLDWPTLESGAGDGASSGPCGIYPSGSLGDLVCILFNICFKPLGEIIVGYGARCHQYVEDIQL